MGRTDFGGALALLRDGKRVSRDGWNGKGMWLVLVPGSTITVSAGRPLGDAVPWVASQTDLLAEDWTEA